MDFSANLLSFKSCYNLSQFISSKHCNLQSLILKNNQIRDLGISILYKSLLESSSVVHLNVNYNQISDQGLVQLADIVSQNQYLISLFAFWNEFGIQSTKDFYQALEDKKGKIFLDFNIIKSDGDL